MGDRPDRSLPTGESGRQAEQSGQVDPTAVWKARAKAYWGFVGAVVTASAFGALAVYVILVILYVAAGAPIRP